MHLFLKSSAVSARTHGRWGVWTTMIQRVTPALIVLFTLVVFARTMQFGLYLDDNHHARPWAAREVLGTFVGPFDPLGIEPPYYRPLPVVTFATDWAIWGWNAWGYHLTNMLLHGVASALVYVFARRIGVAWLAALIGALFFAVIPANAATAIYISERSDAMVTIFSLLGLLFVGQYQRSGKGRFLIAVNAMVVCAVASKEIGVALPLLAIMVWMYLALMDVAGTQPLPLNPQATWHSMRSNARILWRRTTGGAQGKRLGLLAATTLVTLVCYLIYRALVLPTGVLGASYSETKGPLRGLVSAIYWTFKAVPWEVSAPALPLLAATFVLAIMLGWRSPHWRIIVLGFGWVAIACLPLSYLGQVEPRLLYLPEVGYSLVVAGLASILADVVRSSLVNRNPRHVAAGALVLALATAFFGATSLSFVRAQNEFQPFGYKMLRADQAVYTDMRYRHLYAPYRITQIEQKLRQANMLP